MAYINKDGKIGNLHQLLPKVSGATNLSDEQLKQLYDIEKYIAPIKERTLEEVKNDKLKEIKQTYKNISNEGFECSNRIKLDCRESDKINWLTCRISGGNTPIRDFDNQTHVLEPSVIIGMLDELQNYYMKLLSDKWKLENIIKSCTTIEELENIYWRKPIFDDDDEMNVIGYEYNEVL